MHEVQHRNQRNLCVPDTTLYEDAGHTQLDNTLTVSDMSSKPLDNRADLIYFETSDTHARTPGQDVPFELGRPGLAICLSLTFSPLSWEAVVLSSDETIERAGKCVVSVMTF